jgi:hypothetical protein
MQRQVCITIPIYKSFFKLDVNEAISWQQCISVLGKYHFQLICPEGFDTAGYGEALGEANIKWETQRFKASYFANIQGYNKLMLSKEFYERFSQYEYMLLYQLDAFIFKDDLDYWCSQGYAYIGAPWFKGYHTTVEAAQLWKVGNGGFTLRRIADALRALHTPALIQTWSAVISDHFRAGRLYGYTHLHSLLKRLFLGNNTYWLLNDFHQRQQWYQEDYFWGVVCDECFAWYRVPPPVEALAFSFEVLPAKMYELNQHRLPMGCHAWEKYDFDFWKPFIEQFGYRFL